MSAPVTINGRAAVRSEIGGVERVARELASRLPALRPERYRVARPPAALAHRAGHAWEQGWLAAGGARGARLILSPANLAPVASARNVVFVHDVASLREPSWYGSAYARYHRALLSALARRSRLILCPSEFSRHEVIEMLGAPPSRVAAVPLGVDERFSPDADPGPARAAHGLERPYVLTVGSDIRRKNLAALDHAAGLLAEHGIDVVAAGSGRSYMQAEGGHGVRRLGYVADAHLPGLYAGALALAMPSLYEGFGLPCLEAMASGVPVVAASAGALPETCGDAALLVDPEDSGSFGKSLELAATDAGRRGQLREAGLQRAAGFTWQRTAERTDSLVGELLDA